jgi:hypothetical protein
MKSLLKKQVKTYFLLLQKPVLFLYDIKEGVKLFFEFFPIGVGQHDY